MRAHRPRLPLLSAATLSAATLLAATLPTSAMPSSTLPSSIPWAQEVLRRIEPGGILQAWGAALAAAGDVDGDGVTDLWVGGPAPETDFPREAGAAQLRSGADGALLRTLHEARAGELFGQALAAGRDLDGDSVPDVAVGAPAGRGWEPGSGVVRVFGSAFRVGRRAGTPSATLLNATGFAPGGEVLHELRGRASGDGFGSAVLLAGDLDGDGVSEVVVGAPGDDRFEDDGGALEVFSGRTGARLDTFPGLVRNGRLGTALAGVGDLDGDGVDDFLAGAPGMRRGRVLLVSGATRAVLLVVQGDATNDRLGSTVAAAGDVDGDGVGDLAAAGTYGVRVYSGADGQRLWGTDRACGALLDLAPPGTGAGFGAALAGVGDQDGDGRADLLAGDARCSRVTLLSGADGAVLGELASSVETHAIHGLSLPPDAISVHLGAALAALGDLDGDGRDDAAVGAPFDVTTGPSEYAVFDGSVTVLSPWPLAPGVRDVRAVGGAGDVDGDGAADLAYAFADAVHVVSGADGAPLRVLPGLTAHALARAGDVDMDGFEDLLLGDPLPGGEAGVVRVVSGLSGAVLHEVLGAPGDRLGQSVAGVGDLDGDGRADFAAGAPRMVHPSTPGFLCDDDVGFVRAWSGADGTLLLEVQGDGLPGFDCFWQWGEAFGFALSAAGDWNADGTPDLAVGAPGGGDATNAWSGFVRLISGADGAVLHEWRGTGGGEFGISVAGGADFDVDGDGHADLVVGDQDVSYSGVAGRAVVLSGLDGSTLRVLLGSGTAGQYGRGVGPGYAVEALADFDGDGRSDVALGDPIAASPLGPGAGRVEIFSGRTWEELARIDGVSSWDYLGYSIVAPGDVNQDGRTDVLLLAPATEEPSAYPRAVLVEGRE